MYFYKILIYNYYKLHPWKENVITDSNVFTIDIFHVQETIHLYQYVSFKHFEISSSLRFYTPSSVFFNISPQLSRIYSSVYIGVHILMYHSYFRQF